jgi:hypothetical protein
MFSFNPTMSKFGWIGSAALIVTTTAFAGTAEHGDAQSQAAALLAGGQTAAYPGAPTRLDGARVVRALGDAQQQAASTMIAKNDEFKTRRGTSATSGRVNVAAGASALAVRFLSGKTGS